MSPTAPRQSFKDAAIAAANKKKQYNNPSNPRQDDTGTPPPPPRCEPTPSPYRKTAPKRKVPPSKDYDQAFTIDDDVRPVPPKKPQSSHSKTHLNHPAQQPSQNSQPINSSKEPESSPVIIPPNASSTKPSKAFLDFILHHPSIIEHPISSLDIPEIFPQPYPPPSFQTDIIKHPMNAQNLSMFMAGEPAPSRDRPSYDSAAVENTLGFVFYLVTHYFHDRPHATHTEVEDRAALFTELNIVMRTLFSTKDDPHQ